MFFYKYIDIFRYIHLDIHAPFYHLPPEPEGYIILTRSIGAITSLRWKPLCSMVVALSLVK